MMVAHPDTIGLMPVSLTSRDRSRLKARAHALEPVVHIGQRGLTDEVVATIELALSAHELIKVRAATADREGRAGLLETICARTEATPVQSVGKVMVLWRPKPEDPSGTS